MHLRICIDCKQFFDKDAVPGSQRCPTCKPKASRERDQLRGSAAARGYGSAHTRRARAVVAEAIAKGMGCCYCGRPADQPGPRATTGSDPFVGCHTQPQSRGGDPDGPLAAGHRSCNNAAAGKLNRK